MYIFRGGGGGGGGGVGAGNNKKKCLPTEKGKECFPLE